MAVNALVKEWPLAASVATTLLFLLYGAQWLSDLSNPLWFALMLLWDWLIPKLQIRAALRAATLRQARRKATPSPNPELPLSRD